MIRSELHPLAADYLVRLKRAARRLPADQRRELIAEIETHLAEVAPPEASEDDVLEALERLGAPGEIVEADQPAALRMSDQRGIREWGAVILLPLGGFAFGVGWLVGLILLWSSKLWTTRDKLIGTLIIPGGLVTAVYLMLILATGTVSTCSGYASRVNAATGRVIGHGSMHCTTTSQPSTAGIILDIVLAVVLILGPIATAVYLARRARTAPRRLVAANL